MTLSRYSFEDTTVTDFIFENSLIKIHLQGVTNPTGIQEDGDLEFHGVSKLLIENRPSNTASMYYSDGEIIHFDKHQKSNLLIITWADCINHLSKTIAYDISAENVTWTKHD